MHITLFEILMFIITIFIAAGVIRSAKVKNKFATGFGSIALAVFLFTDALIIYYATLPKV